MTTKEAMNAVDGRKRIVQSVVSGMPDPWCLLFCVVSTLLWARVAARFANKASAITLNRATGVVLAVLGIAILSVNYVRG